MAKRLTYSDRKRILAARDMGLTDASIKAQFGFTDDRTLKRHLSLAEHEQEARSVKFEILKDALSSHLAEVRSLIEQWQSIIIVPPIHEVSPEVVLRTHFIESNPLFDSLKEHVPSPTLWRNCAIWVNKLKEYVNESEKLKHDMAEEAHKWGKLRPIAKSFSEPILKRLYRKVVEETPNTHSFEKRVEYINIEGKPVPEYEILIVDGLKTIEANDVLVYESQYKALSDHIIDSEIGVNLINQYSYLNALGQKISKLLHEIILRRDYIMYSCKLCPGQTRILR